MMEEGRRIAVVGTGASGRIAAEYIASHINPNIHSCTTETPLAFEPEPMIINSSLPIRRVVD